MTRNSYIQSLTNDRFFMFLSLEVVDIISKQGQTVHSCAVNFQGHKDKMNIEKIRFIFQ